MQDSKVEQKIKLQEQKDQLPSRQIVFVLGGPGSGKGTQCKRITEIYNVAHLSAGDLLRELVKSGTTQGEMVAHMIKEGKIVPSEVTIGLLQKAMNELASEKGINQFVIDGFPRNMSNRNDFSSMLKTDCSFVLFFDCPEDIMTQRLLGRQEGRTDDNIETIKKRFKVYLEQTMPVLKYYEQEGKLRKIDSNQSVSVIFQRVNMLFEEYDFQKLAN